MGSVALILRQAFWRISSFMIFARILSMDAHKSERANPLKPHTIAILTLEVQNVISVFATPDKNVPVIIILKGDILSPKNPFIIWQAPYTQKNAEPIIPAWGFVKSPDVIISGNAAEKFILPIYEAEYAAKQAMKINVEYLRLSRYCCVFIKLYSFYLLLEFNAAHKA